MNHATAEFTPSYLANLFHQVENLAPGDFIDLSVIKDPAAKEKYIAGVKVYIDEGNNHVEFNSNYSKVRKLLTFGM